MSEKRRGKNTANRRIICPYYIFVLPKGLWQRLNPAYIEKGNAILMEGNHGWSSDYKKISTDDLIELIIRNWDKDWERNGDLKNAIHIQKENNPQEILSAMSNVSRVFVPNYNEAAW